VAPIITGIIVHFRFHIIIIIIIIIIVFLDELFEAKALLMYLLIHCLSISERAFEALFQGFLALPTCLS